jgi:hypothetical protein
MIDYRRGARTEAPVIELEVPNEIKAILAELRSRREDPVARWIAFAILGLSDADLHALSRMMAELRSQNLAPGQLRRNTMTLHDLVITVIASKNLHVEQLYASLIDELFWRNIGVAVPQALDSGLILPIL